MDSSKLREYGARMVTTDGRPTVELRDHARKRFQYRRAGDGIERRLLAADRAVMEDWTEISGPDLAGMRTQRGRYHPILDPLGL